MKSLSLNKRKENTKTVNVSSTHFPHSNKKNNAGLPKYLQGSAAAKPDNASRLSTEEMSSLESAANEKPLSGSETFSATQQNQLTQRPGKSMDMNMRNRFESELNTDFSNVRLHSDEDAQMSAAMLGARAFSQSNNIWLGAGERESDRSLMAHELTHVAEQSDGIYLREATWLERRAWLSFFDHYLPRKFLNNYMDDTGNTITLNFQEMQDVNPRVDIKKSNGFKRELKSLQKQLIKSAATSSDGNPVFQSKYIEVDGPGQAMTNGTLGNFTIKYKGTLMLSPDGTWTFIGVMYFHDYWDFDPKPFGNSGRSTIGEIKTRVAATGLPGSPFFIESVPSPLVQSGSDPRASWAGGKPVFVNDRAGRTGSDIAAGGDVGGAGDIGGPDVAGADVDTGGETGAQSAEDLNP